MPAQRDPIEARRLVGRHEGAVAERVIEGQPRQLPRGHVGFDEGKLQGKGGASTGDHRGRLHDLWGTTKA